jgi:cyclohexyl-isocyanide hydratase
MMGERPLLVGMLCYPRLTQLDLTGPYEVLSRMPDAELHILWKDTAPVKTERGFCIVPTLSLPESPNLDVLVVPGGLGQRDLMDDDEVLSFLRKQVERTLPGLRLHGLALAGGSGTASGYRATCHWMFLPLLEPLGAMPIQERVVIDRNRITAAGVSAGIDCALQLVSLLGGQEVAQAIQLQIKYDPHPPFRCGSPNTAPENLVRRITEESRTVLDARRATIQRLSKARTS